MRPHYITAPKYRRWVGGPSVRTPLPSPTTREISACHLKMRGDRQIGRLTQGRRSMVIDYYWTVSNVNCKPLHPITPH